MDKNAILKAIGAIGRSSDKLRGDVQQVIVAVTWHAAEHGDVTLADRLIEAMGRAMRAKAATDWLITNGPFVISGKTFTLNKDAAKALRKEGRDAVVARLAGIPWEDAKIEPAAPDRIDVAKALDETLDKLAKRVAKAAAGGAVIEHLDLLNQAAVLVARFQARLILGEAADRPVFRDPADDAETAPAETIPAETAEIRRVA